jgi:hypothetical protein
METFEATHTSVLAACQEGFSPGQMIMLLPFSASAPAVARRFDRPYLGKISTWVAILK